MAGRSGKDELMLIAMDVQRIMEEKKAAKLAAGTQPGEEPEEKRLKRARTVSFNDPLEVQNRGFAANFYTDSEIIEILTYKPSGDPIPVENVNTRPLLFIPVEQKEEKV